MNNIFIDSLRFLVGSLKPNPPQVYQAEDDLSYYFHAIRPIVWHYSQKSNCKIRESEREMLGQYVQQQTFLNLLYTNELKNLLQLFHSHSLRVLPYKGVLFLHELYANKQLREVGDIDILVHPADAEKALHLLVNEGYKFNHFSNQFDELPLEDFIKKVIHAKGQYEIPLQKGNCHIDFHWGLHYGFLPYQIDFNRFFETSIEKEFYGAKGKFPSKETIFWMLILHHGGKEFWTRMKHFADLQAFLTTYGSDLDWNKILETAKSYKLFQTTLMGFYLLANDFHVSIPTEAQSAINQHLNSLQKRSKTIKNYWNFAKPWDKLYARLKFEQLLAQNQDEGFSWMHYFNEFYKTYTLPNPTEDKRIIDFPENYPTLNFISKLFTYFIKKLK